DACTSSRWTGGCASQADCRGCTRAYASVAGDAGDGATPLDTNIGPTVVQRRATEFNARRGAGPGSVCAGRCPAYSSACAGRTLATGRGAHANAGDGPVNSTLIAAQGRSPAAGGVGAQVDTRQGLRQRGRATNDQTGEQHRLEF